MSQILRLQSLRRFPLRWFLFAEFGIPHLAKMIQSATRFLPPQVLLLLAMVSVQLGAAFAKSLFPPLGSTGTVFLRLTFAALILLLIWRPRLSGYKRFDYVLVVLLGCLLLA